MGHFQKYHITLCLPSKILHKHCVHFLLGLTMVPRENKNNAYAKFWRANKKYYGIFESGPVESLSKLPFWATDGNRRWTFCMPGQWSLPNFQTNRLYYWKDIEQYKCGIEKTSLMCPQLNSGCRPWLQNVAYFNSLLAVLGLEFQLVFCFF